MSTLIIYLLVTLIVCAFAGTVLLDPAFRSDLKRFVADNDADPLETGRLQQLVGEISVIIPARNEELTLPPLLDSLGLQTLRPREILVVDDQSDDNTAVVAADLGTRVIGAGERPADWLGKPWALSTGAEAATGSLLLFLDADVQLRPTALETLGRALLTVAPEWPTNGATISVQPYHRTVRLWERLAVFFNILVFVGSARPRGGLRFTLDGGCCFGPCILCGRDEYHAVGGHRAVHNRVLDDMELGSALARAGGQLYSFSGRGVVDFRMYSTGVRALLDGFTKNLLLGAKRSCTLFRLFAVLWFTGLLAVPGYIGVTAALGMLPEFVVATVFYTFFVIQIGAAGARLGNFGLLPSLFFPIPLALFLLVLLRALLLSVRGRNVEWKGRRLNPESLE